MMMASSDQFAADAGGASAAGEMPAIVTRFGPVTINPENQVTFKGGLPGFPSLETYQLDAIPGVPGDLLLLQALDDADIGFIVMTVPQSAGVIAAAEIGDVCRKLNIAAGDLLLLSVVSLQPGADGKGVRKFANLRAPLFIDVRNRRGAQVVLANPDYPLRFDLDAARPAA